MKKKSIIAVQILSLKPSFNTCRTMRWCCITLVTCSRGGVACQCVPGERRGLNVKQLNRQLFHLLFNNVSLQ